MRIWRDAESDDVAFERAPPRLSLGVATVVAASAVLLVAVSVRTFAVAATGTVVAAAGLARGSCWTFRVGVGGLFGSVPLAGAAGASPELLLLTSFAVVLAWDTGENALTIGEQVGRGTSTTRIELVHVASTLVVLATAGGVGYVAFRQASGGEPMLGLVALLLGALSLIAGLQR